MAVSEKSRKILWGKSGNRCAICRRELMVAATSNDDASIIGEECHIVSGKAQGPRYDPTYPVERLNDPSNLILLCRVDHKAIDDQCAAYSVERLRALKADHEKWVASQLNEKMQVRIRRIKENIPKHLLRLTSARDVMAIMESACAGSFEHDAPESSQEAELFAEFLQEAQDWADLSAELEAKDRVSAKFRMNALLQGLEQAGFWVFGSREIQLLEGGRVSPLAWPVSKIRITYTTNPEIVCPLTKKE